MWALVEALETMRDYHFAGGAVLWIIGLVAVMIWAIIIERLLYFRRAMPRDLLGLFAQWYARPERHSWYARQVRRMLIAQAAARIEFSLPVLRMLVKLCLLLGLLGTVTGMVEIFETMNVFGSANPRLMASGISRATLPTMAGMGTAIYGLFAMRLLCRHASRQIELFADTLTIHLPQEQPDAPPVLSHDYR